MEKTALCSTLITALIFRLDNRHLKNGYFTHRKKIRKEIEHCQKLHKSTQVNKTEVNKTLNFKKQFNNST